MKTNVNIDKVVGILRGAIEELRGELEKDEPTEYVCKLMCEDGMHCIELQPSHPAFRVDYEFFEIELPGKCREWGKPKWCKVLGKGGYTVYPRKPITMSRPDLTWGYTDVVSLNLHRDIKWME
jgi:hypothetical protein